MITPAQVPPPSRKRRIIAAALCPLLGTAPLALLTLYDQRGLTSLDSLWTYFGGTYFAYAAAPVAIPIF